MSKNRMMVAGGLIAVLVVAGVVTAAEGEPLNIRLTEKMPYVDVTHEGRTVRIQRIQDEENVITGGFAKTSRKCPPFCIHPMQAAPGVETAGELELIDFLKQRVEKGTGLLIDARTPEWYHKGTIPGSVNLPFTAFEKEDGNPELQQALARLGVQTHSAGLVEKLMFNVKKLFGSTRSERALNWNFGKAKDLMLWCNGPWCDQSPRAIRNLIALGYPAEKLRYYRGGMQDWLVLGLTVTVPEQ